MSVSCHDRLSSISIPLLADITSTFFITIINCLHIT